MPRPCDTKPIPHPAPGSADAHPAPDSANAHPIPGVGPTPRNPRAIAAQLLRDRADTPAAPQARIIVCRGGLEIDAHARLWHRDCPTPDAVGPDRHASDQEMTA